MNKIITIQDANLCLWYFKKHISKKSTLIGSFGKGAESSSHDIDIFIPELFPKGVSAGMRRVKFTNKLKALLDPTAIEDTDWGGMYLYDTPFGDIYVFFDTSKFEF